MIDRAKRVKRDISGIFLLDKPQGLTSNQALQRVKRLYHARKAGHTGSLDPMATGVLPVCLGEATKISSYLLGSEKTYQVRCVLGQATNTGDADGEITHSVAVPELTEQAVQAVLDQFLGASEQIPPMYSALKHKGKRLYELARAGQEVERPPRAINISYCQLNELTTHTIRYTVGCSKGTYVRTLSEDIAKKLGTLGHINVLRRTHVGHFNIQNCITLAALDQYADSGNAALDALLQPIDVGIKDWPPVTLDEHATSRLLNGQAVSPASSPELSAPLTSVSGLVRVYGPQQTFLGLGAINADGHVAPKRLMRRST